MADDEVPVVSGVSPKEGYPGTKVTIRGQNLGINKNDVTNLTICGVSCIDTLEYFSSKKLVCQSPKYVGAGEIVVTTFSGGPGTCNVKFVGLEQPEQPLLDPLVESDVWMEEDLDSLTRGFSTKAETPVYTRKIIDPLGGSPETTRSRQKLTRDELGGLFKDANSNLLSQNFNPVWFLLEKHRYTSFFDLKLGARRLQNELERSEQAPVRFMIDHLDAFLQCYDTLSDVNELLIRNESESQGGSLTDSVEELLQDSARKAEAVFDGVLKCKVRADATRNALLVLQRYRFLFSLPRSIEKNIKNGEYDLVTTDYEKAKSLFAGTQVNIFKKVLAEVENLIRNFRDELYKMLRKLPSTLEEQKKIIKYLLELDCDGDPAWDCITAMHQWLLRLLFSSKEEYQALPARDSTEDLSSQGVDAEAPPAIPPRSRSKAGSVGPFGEGHQRTMSDVSYASSVSSQASQTTTSTQPSRSQEREIKPSKELDIERYQEWQQRRGGIRFKGEGGRPARILFVEELTDMVQEILPDIWKLGQAYLSHSLFHGVSTLEETTQRLTMNCEYHQPKFETMILEIIQVYTDMVNSSLFYDAYKSLTQKRKEKLGEWVPFDDPLMESSGDWLPLIVRQIKECVDSLHELKLPESTVEITQQLTFNVRTLCADTLFHRAARDIEVLHEREDWRVHAEAGGIITSLPILFENMVVEVLLTLKEIVIEVDSDTMDTINKELLLNTVQHFHSLLEHFTGCFDYLAFHQEEELQQEAASVENEQSLATVRGEEADGNSPNSDERLLTIMSNLSYVIDEVIPRLFDCFVRHGYPDCPDVHEAIMEKLHELDDAIFNEYIKRKIESIAGIIEQGIQVGYFDWETCGEPQVVRNYVKDVLLNLVLIHSEVYAVSSQIVTRVLNRLVELVSGEFLKKIREVEVFSYNGIIYAYVELTALEDTLKPYIDKESARNFDMSRDYLGEWDVHSTEGVGKIVSEFKEKTKLQLRCFKVKEDFDDDS